MRVLDGGASLQHEVANSFSAGVLDCGDEVVPVRVLDGGALIVDEGGFMSDVLGGGTAGDGSCSDSKRLWWAKDGCDFADFENLQTDMDEFSYARRRICPFRGFQGSDSCTKSPIRSITPRVTRNRRTRPRAYTDCFNDIFGLTLVMRAEVGFESGG